MSSGIELAQIFRQSAREHNIALCLRETIKEICYNHSVNLLGYRSWIFDFP